MVNISEPNSLLFRQNLQSNEMSQMKIALRLQVKQLWQQRGQDNGG